MGAEAFDGRVRDGIGSGSFAWATRPAKINLCPEALGLWRVDALPCGLSGAGAGME